MEGRATDQDGLPASLAQGAEAIGNKVLPHTPTGVGLHVAGDAQLGGRFGDVKQEREIQKRLAAGEVHLLWMLPGQGSAQGVLNGVGRHPVLPFGTTVVQTVGAGALSQTGKGIYLTGRFTISDAFFSRKS